MAPNDSHAQPEDRTGDPDILGAGGIPASGNDQGPATSDKSSRSSRGDTRRSGQRRGESPIGGTVGGAQTTLEGVPVEPDEVPAVMAATDASDKQPKRPGKANRALVEVGAGAAHLVEIQKGLGARYLTLKPGLSYDQWQGAGRFFERVSTSLPWWIADWMTYGDAAYGEKASQASFESGYSYERISTFVWVSKCWPTPTRVYDLPFGHYEEVAGLAQKNPTVAQELMQRAVNEGLSQSDLRRLVKEMRRRDRQDAGTLPVGVYSLVYADPPWRHDDTVPNRDVENHYPTMSTEQIVGMELPHIAPQAVLFLWAVPSMREDAMHVMKQWGFDYKGEIVWDKTHIGMGHYVRYRHETLMIGTSGDFGPPDESVRPASVIAAPRMEHSQKPPVFRQIIERMYPHASRIELFAREVVPGWAGWGKDYPGTKPNEPTSVKGTAKSKAEQAKAGKGKGKGKASANGATSEPLPEADPSGPSQIEREPIEGELAREPVEA